MTQYQQIMTMTALGAILSMGVIIGVAKPTPDVTPPVATLQTTSAEVVKPLPAYLNTPLEDRLCLYMTVVGEARGEPRYGQNAVASIIVNRVASPKFPDTICGVVKQHKRTRDGRTVYQFATWSPSDDNYTVMHDAVDGDLTEAAYVAAEVGMQVLNGDKVLPDDALNYHAVTVKPVWRHKLTKVATIEGHVFYTGY